MIPEQPLTPGALRAMQYLVDHPPEFDPEKVAARIRSLKHPNRFDPRKPLTGIALRLLTVSNAWRHEWSA